MRSKCFLLPILIFSLNSWAGEIDALNAIQNIKKLGTELKLEEAEKYFQDLVSSGDEWCISKGKCRDQERIRKSVEKTLNEVRLCVPVARICSGEKLDKKSAEECIAEMKSKCSISKPNEVGHPNSMAKILALAEERLPSLKYASTKMPANIAEAYNKCQEEVAWGYIGRSKPKDHNIIRYAQGKPQIIGEFKTESDCHEARILAKEKKDFDIDDSCVKRFIGKNEVVVTLAEAKAMVKLPGGDIPSDQDLTFSSLEKCQENILKKRKYKFQVREYQFEEIEIGPYKSTETMRFISNCKEKKKVVCKKDESEFSNLEYFD